MSELISFVIPFMNEEEVLPQLFQRLDGLRTKIDGDIEIILIDDGSTDDSAAIVANAMPDFPDIRLLRLSRNFGHQIAVTAGLDRAQGDAVIIMDADLQDPPEVALELIDSWKQGNQIVHAQRNRREGETWFKKFTSKLFCRILNRLSSVHIPRDVGDFRLVDAAVLQAIRQMPERDRFLRGMFSWVGFKQAIVKYDRAKREAGVSKYPLAKMMKLALDGVVGFSDGPLRMALWLGAIVSAGAILYGAYIMLLAIFTDTLIAGWASTVVILSFLSGVNLLISGVIGLYVGRIHTESKQRPLYFISEDLVGKKTSTKTGGKRNVKA